MGTINFTPSKPGAKTINFTPANNTPVAQPDPGFFSNVKKDLVNRAKGIKETAVKTYQGKINPLQTGLRVVGDVAGGVGDIIGEGIMSGIKTVNKNTPDFAKTVVKNIPAVKVATDYTMGILKSDIGREGLKMAAKGMDYYGKWKQNNPETAKDLESLVNIASLAPIQMGAKAVAPIVGETAKIAGAVTKGAGTAIESGGKYAAAQTSGLSMKTVENIISNPKALTEAEKSGLDALHLGSKVKKAIDARVADLGSTGKAYEGIRRGEEMVQVPREVITSVLDKYGIGLDDAGKLIMNEESVPLKPGDVSAIESFVEQYGKEMLSGNAFMNARTALTQMKGNIFETGKSDFSTLIAKALRKSYDTLGKEQLGKGSTSGLAALDAIYAPEKKALGALKKEFIDKSTGELKDNAFTKIANATNEGKQNVIKRLESLVPGITEDINMFRALKDIEAVKSQKVGAYASNAFKSGMGGFAVSGGSPIAALAGMVLSSPQVVVPILKTYGKLKGFSGGAIDSIITKMKTGKVLLDKESQLVNRAIVNAADKFNNTKFVESVKNIKPGMTVDDVSDPLLKEAKQYKTFEEFAAAQNKKSGPPVYRGMKPGQQLAESGPGEVDFGPGYYFADKVSTAKGYGPESKSYRVVLNNPFKIKDRYAMNAVWDDFIATKPKQGFTIQDWLKGKGHDGVVVEDGGMGGEKGVGGFKIAFDKSQIRETSPFELNDVWNKANLEKTTKPVKLNSDISINGGSRIRLDGLNQEGQAMEAAAFNKLDKSRDQIISDYEKQFGNIYNPDDFRPIVHDETIFGPYDGTKAENVHEAVSEISNYIKNKRIDEIKPGELVMWTSGGPGSGKTTAIKAVNPTVYDDIKFGYDSVLGNPTKAIRDINNVLKNGGENFVPHVVRDIEDAWMNGVVARAISKGRTVPLKIFLDGTEKANQSIRILYNEFIGNDKVRITFFDNRTPGGKASKIAFEDFDKIDMADLEKKFYEKLFNETQKLYENGSITKKIRDGLLGK